MAIPVTVKMRTGWDDHAIVAPEFAKRMEEAGASAVTVHGRSGAQSYGGSADWDVIARVARAVSIPVLGNGDCVEPEQIVRRWRETGVGGVMVGRGVVRNPWLLEQAADVAEGRPARAVTRADRARFLLEYIDLLLGGEAAGPGGFRWIVPRAAGGPRPANGDRAARERRVTARGGSRERWVINKLRALVAWYTKGLDGGSRLRASINQAASIQEVRDTLEQFFLQPSDTAPAGRCAQDADLRV